MSSRLRGRGETPAARWDRYTAMCLIRNTACTGLPTTRTAGVHPGAGVGAGPGAFPGSGALVQMSDYLIESFAPGYLEGLDLGWAHLRQLNPRLDS